MVQEELETLFMSRCAGVHMCWVSRCAGVQVCWGWTSVSSISNSFTAKHKLQGRTIPATPSPGPPLAHLCTGESCTQHSPACTRILYVTLALCWQVPEEFFKSQSLPPSLTHTSDCPWAASITSISVILPLKKVQLPKTQHVHWKKSSYLSNVHLHQLN